jgi:hypothetical protein
MTVAFPYKRLRINRLRLGSRRRLILFIMIIYVSQECDYHSDKQEKKLPRHVHIASPPLIIMKGEKELFAPF